MVFNLNYWFNKCFFVDDHINDKLYCKKNIINIIYYLSTIIIKYLIVFKNKALLMNYN